MTRKLRPPARFVETDAALPERGEGKHTATVNFDPVKRKKRG